MQSPSQGVLLAGVGMEQLSSDAALTLHLPQSEAECGGPQGNGALAA
jgi:hypothetical protein